MRDDFFKSKGEVDRGRPKPREEDLLSAPEAASRGILTKDPWNASVLYKTGLWTTRRCEAATSNNGPESSNNDAGNMIEYSDEWGGMSLLTRLRGSPFASSVLLFSLGSSIIATLISSLSDRKHYASYFGDPGVPVQLFGLTLGAILLGRLLTSYQRFCSTESRLRRMSSKWSDVFLHAVIFDQSSDITPTATKGPVFQRNLVHQMSLLHALALLYLRGDLLLENLIQEKTPSHMRPPLTQYRRSFRSFLRSAAGCFQSKTTKLENLNKARPLAVINGLTENEAYFLRGCDDKVQCVLAWITRMIVTRARAGGLNVPAPAVALLHQWLSDGQTAYMELRGIVDTQFPFPFAQLVEVLLLAFTILFPVTVPGYLFSPLLVWIFTLITVLAFRTVNEVAKVLENPFTSHPNSLPVQRLQYEFNFRIAFLCKEFLLDPPSPGDPKKTSDAPGEKEKVPSQPPPAPPNAEKRQSKAATQIEPGQSPKKNATLVATAVEKLKEQGLEVQTATVKQESVKPGGSPRKAENENPIVRQKAFLKPVQEETQESPEVKKKEHRAPHDPPTAKLEPLTRTSSNAAYLPEGRSRSSSTGRIRSPPKPSRPNKDPRPVEPLNIVVEQKRHQAAQRPIEAGTAVSPERKRHSTGANVKVEKGDASAKYEDEAPAKYRGIRPSFIETAENLLESVPSNKTSTKKEPVKNPGPVVQHPAAKEKALFAPNANDAENGDICLYDEEVAATPAAGKEYLPW